MRASNLLKIVALLLAALSIVLTASCSLTGDEEETTTESEVVTLVERPKSVEDIVAFYNDAVNAIKAKKPGVKRSVWADVREVDTGDNAEAKALIAFAEQFADALDKQSETKEYGSDLNDFLPIKGTADVSRLTVSDVAKATLEDDDEKDRFVYEVHIVLKDGKEDGPAKDAFDFEANKNDILGTFRDYRDTVEVGDYDVSYNGCEITATINKETNRVVNLKLVKNSIVTADVVFAGTLESLGETTIKFNLQQTQEYNDFVWDKPTTTQAAEE